MFECIIDRIAENLGIPKKDALRSSIIKKLCIELLNDQAVIIDSRNNKILVEAAYRNKDTKAPERLRKF